MSKPIRAGRAYLPKQGDIVLVNFDPQSGHEPKVMHPALVVSKEQFNRATSLVIVCPILLHEKGFPLHVSLDSRTKTTGVILCDHVKSIDPIARGIKFIERCPDDIWAEAVDIVIGAIEI